MSDNIWNKIQDSYEKSTETVSDEIWNRLESQLDEKKSIRKSYFSQQNWLKYAAVVVFLVSIVGLLFYQNNSTQTTESVIAHQTKIDEEAVEGNFSDERLENSEVISSEKNEMVQVNKKVAKENLNTNETSKVAKISIQSKREKEIEIKERPKVYVDHTEKKINPAQKAPSKMDIIEDIPAKTALAASKKYVKASDLLFERELNKVAIEQSSDTATSKLGKVDKNRIPTPKNLKVFGITVFEDKKN